MDDYKLFLRNDLELVSENMAVSSFKNKYENYLSKQKYCHHILHQHLRSCLPDLGA